MRIKHTLLVIGNGMVGHYFLTNLVVNPIKADYEIVIFCEEPRVAYDRVHLSSFFTGTSAAELSLVEDSFFEQHGITIHIGDKAVNIDRETKIVTSAKGIQIHYDKLVLATGSYPFVPPIAGHDRPQCLVYRTIEDLEAMSAAAKNSKVGTVIGGGLLGLEAAKALSDLGLKTHIVEFAPRLMEMQLDEAGGAMLRSKIEALGIKVHTSKNTVNITDGAHCMNKMCFADDETLETDLIIFSTGIRPRDELARASGLAIGQRGGVVIDNQCKTSDPDIYAIGECAAWNDLIYGLVAPGYAMARTVVADLAGDNANFTGADMSTKLKLLGVDVGSIGDALGKSYGALVYSYQNGAAEIYKRIVVSNDCTTLLGAVLVGDTSNYDTLMQYYSNGLYLPENPDVLILPSHSGEFTSLNIETLPASTIVCACQNVTKGTICQAIEAGCHTVNEIKKKTQVAIGCGGCLSLLKSVIETELAKQA